MEGSINANESTTGADLFSFPLRGGREGLLLISSFSSVLFLDLFSLLKLGFLHNPDIAASPGVVGTEAV